MLYKKWENVWAVHKLLSDLNKVYEPGAGREILYNILVEFVVDHSEDLEVNATILMKWILEI
jgi:hypothetical protein